MCTEYAKLNNDSRPELIGGFNIKSNDEENKIKKVITVNENKFMNMSLSQIFD